MMNGEIRVLLDAIDQAFDKRSWHGTNLRGAIRGLGVERATWRPSPGAHNIWEVVVHAAYWKYAVRRRLRRERRGSFPLDGSNWFARPASENDGDAQWRSDVDLLVSTHRSLRDAIAGLGPSDVSRRLGSVTARSLALGIAAHDLYHAGQIQLLKRLQRDSATSGSRAPGSSVRRRPPAE
jgi:hypothetical protein